MKVKTVHKTAIVGPAPNRSYNPSIFIPGSIWLRLQNRDITVKSLVILGWKIQRSRDVKMLESILSYDDEDARRIIDILSVLSPVEEKKKIHLKFMSRESDIAIRIYEQHLRLRTTISNYLLYLLILGMYLNSRVILNYSTSDKVRTEAEKDEQVLKKIMERILVKRLEKESINISKSVIIKKLMEISKRNFIRHAKRIERLHSPEDFARYLLEHIIFNMRPSINAKYYVKIFTGAIK
ncbi:MAG: hypothetical protein GXO10_05850 [Crenarchaeota archaeon]|nr:hypothetical protein [Thermoproteota archaeon]